MLDLENSARHSPFFVSIIKGFLEMAELLLVDEMSNINIKDSKDDTALHWACILGNEQAVKFLLSKGAKFDNNTDGNNPVMIACINQKQEVLRILLNHFEATEVKKREAPKKDNPLMAY